MALGSGDAVRQDILLRLRANPKQAKRAMKSFERETQTTTQAIKANWAKIAGGIAAVTGAIKLASDSFQTFAEDARLAAAAAEADIDALKIATQGLVSEVELMRFAAAGMTGDLHITEEQLQQVARAALVFRKEGTSLNRTMELLTDFLREGSVDAMENLGIVTEATGTEMERFQAVVKEAAERQAEFTDGQLRLAGDEAVKGMVLVEDFWRTTKNIIGGAVAGTAEFMSNVIGLTEATREAAAAFRELQGVRAERDAFIRRSTERLGGAEREIDLFQRGFAALSANGVDMSGLSPEQVIAVGRALAGGVAASRIGEANAQFAAGNEALRRAGQRGAGAGGIGPSARDVGLGVTDPGAIGGPEAGGIGAVGLGGGGALGAMGALDAPTGDKNFSAFSDVLSQLQTEATSAERAINMLGLTMEEVFADSGAAAMRTFQSAATDAIVAMSKGAMDLGEAWELVAGQIVNSIGTQLIQRGVSALAEAAILAFKPGAQANAAGLAAAGGVAIATGTSIVAVGKELGFGGEQTSARPAAGGGGSPPAVAGLGQPQGSGGEGGNNITVVLGSEWHAMSPTERRYHWNRFLGESGRDSGAGHVRRN